MSDTSAFNKAYATETSQFLAPYESSMNKNNRDKGSEVSLASVSGMQQPSGASASTNDVSRAPPPDTRSLSADIADWNPFGETPFNQLTEDHIFGAEFDKIRRGSQSSIQGVKSRESLVMSVSEDPFGCAPFSLPARRGASKSAAAASAVPVTPATAAPASLTASPLTKRTFAQLSPTYEYSPEHGAALLSEGEAPLLDIASSSTIITSPPFVRAPLEDRSKYEKFDDLSSDSDDGTIIAKTDPKQKKHHGYDSDDSIGSASDLRANEDVLLEIHDDKKVDDISETISESIRTCGSSAYHAECESMATKEDDIISRAVRLKKAAHQQQCIPITANIQQNNEDLLFVGHQYGDKPLLLDDELDSDCELKLDNSTWSIEKKAPNPKDIWIEPKNFEDSDDVFAQAPFCRSIVRKKKLQNAELRRISPLKEEIETSEIFFEKTETPSPLLMLSPPVNNENEQQIVVNTNLNPFVANNIVQSSSSYGIVTVNSNILNIPVPDAFGDNNFDAFSIHTTPTDILTPTNYFPFPQQATMTYCDTKCDNEAIYENVTLPDAFNSEDIAFMKKQSEENELPPFPENNLFLDFNQDHNKKSKGKSKYQLIETDGDMSLKNLKKKDKISKSKKTKVPKSQVAFSNMSFEDFPSDEEKISNVSTPFEVKRRSNPFS